MVKFTGGVVWRVAVSIMELVIDDVQIAHWIGKLDLDDLLGTFVQRLIQANFHTYADVAVAWQKKGELSLSEKLWLIASQLTARYLWNIIESADYTHFVMVLISHILVLDFSLAHLMLPLCITSSFILWDLFVLSFSLVMIWMSKSSFWHLCLDLIVADEKCLTWQPAVGQIKPGEVHNIKNVAFVHPITNSRVMKS